MADPTECDGCGTRGEPNESWVRVIVEAPARGDEPAWTETFNFCPRCEGHVHEHVQEWSSTLPYRRKKGELRD